MCESSLLGLLERVPRRGDQWSPKTRRQTPLSPNLHIKNTKYTLTLLAYEKYKIHSHLTCISKIQNTLSPYLHIKKIQNTLSLYLHLKYKIQKNQNAKKMLKPGKKLWVEKIGPN